VRPGVAGAGRGTRVVRRRIGRAARSAWGFTGALLVIVLGSVMLVDELHDRANVQRQAQVAASELEQDAAELRQAETALMTGKQVAEAETEIRDELADLYATASVLRGLGEQSIAADIERALRTGESALESQLASVLAGEPAAAEEVAERRTAPALDVLQARVGATSDYYGTTADRSSRLSDIGLWVSVLTAGVAIGGLSWRHERARRAAQRQMEQRLRDRVAEVAEITERHRQLEAMKYSFVTAVSHELRTPLTAIHGSLEMLEDGDVGTLPPAVARVVAVAARGTRRLARLVEEIIDLERLESGLFGFHPEPHDLHDLLLETVESLAPLTESAGVALVLHDTHADVLCDGDRVLQALTNLVGNAIKFTPPGGSIHLGVARRDEEVEVTVRDEGRGIPEEQLDAVFERFHQVDTEADQAKGGAGLGLTITRHIIEAQGGRIWAESQVGAGTSFRFTLPRTRPEPHHPEALAEEPAGSVVS
jgi:signal transduction histidine kinase